MYRAAFLLVLLPAVAFATEGWRSCDGIKTPIRVNISDCAVAPCNLKRGSTVRMESAFVVPEYSEELATKAYFDDLTSGVSGSYPLPSSQKATCNNLIGSRCPVYDDEEVIYTLEMPILPIYPTGIDLNLKITVDNGSGKTLTCFQVLARTVA